MEGKRGKRRAPYVQGSEVVPRLRECCRQSQAELVSKSSIKIHQTWGPPFLPSFVLISFQNFHIISITQSQLDHADGDCIPTEEVNLLPPLQAAVIPISTTVRS